MVVSLLAAHKSAGLPCSSMGVIAPFRSQVSLRPKTQTELVLPCMEGGTAPCRAGRTAEDSGKSVADSAWDGGM